PSLGGAVSPNLQHQLRQRSRALFVLLAVAVVGGDVWLLRVLGHGPFVAAVVAVAGALAVAGAYGWLIDRGHARWAIVAGGGVLTAIAALDQLLSHFLKS